MSYSVWSLLPEVIRTLSKENQKRLEHLLVSDVVSDSRLVKKGDLFCALPGIDVDGRQFVGQALAAGAVLAIVQGVEEEPLGLDIDKQLFIVDNIIDVVGAIASSFYNNPCQHMHLVGVTGTNGKTTTSYLIASLAEALGVRAAVMGTNGYGSIDALRPQSVTTPGIFQLQAQLAEMRDLGIELVVMEVSSHALVQGRVSGCTFKAAVLTNISRDHLDYHGDFQSYLAAKQLLFARPELEHIIVNANDLQAFKCISQAKKAQRWVYARFEAPFCAGIESQDDLSGIYDVRYGAKCAEMKISLAGEVCVLFPALIGEFNFANLAAAIMVIQTMGYSLAKITQASEKIQMPQGRMQCVDPVALYLPQVIVDFAHTPDAIRVVLEALKPLVLAKGGKLLVVFGCGGERDRGKRSLMAAEVQRSADIATVTADNARSESLDDIYFDITKGFSQPSSCQVFRYDDRAQAIKKTIDLAGHSDIVAILGKGHEKYQDIAGRCSAFDDVAEVQKVLEQQMKEIKK